MPRHSQSAAILSDGFRIAYQQWQGAAAGTGTGSAGGVGKRCLCLHGWLDNSSSFSVLGPYLADRGYTVVAIDHVGHGHSSHTSHDQMNQFSKYVFHVKEMLKELEWDSATLIGHSMGGGISTLFAGAYPELVDKLVLIDGFGPVSKDPSTAVATLRKALDEESKFHSKDINIGGGRLYENVSEAVKARMATVRRFPGEQYISEEAALQLIMRGTYPARAVDTTDENYFDEPSISEAVRFRHDPKLTLPSYTYNTHEQVLAFIDNIKSPTLYLSAENGFPYATTTVLQDRMKMLSDKGLLQHIHSEGSHHLHLDPQQALDVAQNVCAFLDN